MWTRQKLFTLKIRVAAATTLTENEPALNSEKAEQRQLHDEAMAEWKNTENKPPDKHVTTVTRGGLGGGSLVRDTSTVYCGGCWQYIFLKLNCQLASNSLTYFISLVHIQQRWIVFLLCFY